MGIAIQFMIKPQHRSLFAGLKAEHDVKCRLQAEYFSLTRNMWHRTIIAVEVEVCIYHIERERVNDSCFRSPDIVLNI